MSTVRADTMSTNHILTPIKVTVTASPIGSNTALSVTATHDATNTPTVTPAAITTVTAFSQPSTNTPETRSRATVASNAQSDKTTEPTSMTVFPQFSRTPTQPIQNTVVSTTENDTTTGPTRMNTLTRPNFTTAQTTSFPITIVTGFTQTNTTTTETGNRATVTSNTQSDTTTGSTSTTHFTQNMTNFSTENDTTTGPTTMNTSTQPNFSTELATVTAFTLLDTNTPENGGRATVTSNIQSNKTTGPTTMAVSSIFNFGSTQATASTAIISTEKETTVQPTRASASTQPSFHTSQTSNVGMISSNSVSSKTPQTSDPTSSTSAEVTLAFLTPISTTTIPLMPTGVSLASTPKPAVPTTKSPPPEPAISLEFRIVKKFDEDLKNSSSVTYKELSNTLTKQLDMVYSEKYGPRFNHTKINGFRNGSIVVDTTLVFNNISSVPNTSDVAETLKAAATSNNTSNNATLISQVTLSSIVATIPKQTPPMTTRTPTTQQRNTLTLPQTINTMKPTTMSLETLTLHPETMTTNHIFTPLKTTNTASPTGSNTPLSVTITHETTNRQSVTPAEITTAEVTTAAANVKLKTIMLQFSLQEEFTNELLDRHSDKYLQLEKNITTELNKIYSKEFSKSFFGSRIKGFRNGSVITDLDLLFKEEESKDEFVSATEVLKTLQTALSPGNSFLLNILPESIQAFEEISVSVNLSLVLSFSHALNDSKSSYYREISTALHQWLAAVFSKFYEKKITSPSVKFRNIDGWVAVTTEFKFIAERKIADDMLTDAILSSQGPFLYLKHFLVVNDFQAPVDSFSLSLRITSLSFSDDLANRGSQQFLLYSTLIRTAVKKLYADRDGFCDVYVMNMTSGSVVVELAVIFEKIGISSSSVSQILLSGLPQLELDGLTADPDSLQTVSEPQLSTSPRPFPGFAVAIIVMCGFAILLLPVAMVVGCKTRSLMAWVTVELHWGH
ncbi:hypothetical protein AGOR_G00232270 [Albula goreensis]|uniref:SEA domain-containing protein n=1 Tax=Albula goreensis TaxID=1534307 RepID=A0A8T3CER8_9TELE|nr:hypothetical protein AGOR_G00232270 [Albula goreensis]